ncbi:class I tRNA ligase family protein [Candidatus Vidania fulgoroideorum]
MKINIFYTKFRMKANLIKLEKKIEKIWKKEKIYKKIIKDKKRKKFILHDGPPYANGDVHFGHVLNKIIKDITIKKKNMYGYRTIYLPGWDCHGTPIELKVCEKGKKNLIHYRRYAKKQIKNQKRVFKKIGMLYDWKKYYKTMSFEIESKEIKFFRKIYKKKLIKRNKKIVNWCYNCKSSLSEYEIENSKISCSYYYIYFLNKGKKFLFLAKYNDLNYKVIGISINCKEKICLISLNYKRYYIIKSQISLIKNAKLIKEKNINSLKKNKKIIIDKNKTEVLYSIKIISGIKKKSKIFKKGTDVCWRHKCIIYRTVLTHWFIKTDFKKNFYKEINKIKFYPQNTKKIFKSYLKDRPDWNIARQKKWGVPICLIYKKKSKKIYLLKNFSNIVKKKGIEAWNELKINKKFKKSKDTLDVWFDSGISHYTVLKNPKVYKYNKIPADVYIEGIDQHRGWFNASIITSHLYNNKNCTKAFVTHGFVLDKNGNKMSKSLGNYINVESILSKYGSEILRIYFSIRNFNKNIEFSINEIEKTKILYKKLRYIIRFILNNIKKKVKKNYNYEEIDIYILNELKKTINKVKKYDDKYEYYNSFRIIKEFCIKKLSNFYFSVIKDRLYLTELNSVTRRVCFTVLSIIFKKIIILLSPYLSYTCEEAWRIEKKKSIFLKKIKNIKIKKSKNNWKKIFKIRKKVIKNKKIYKNKVLRLYFYIEELNLSSYEIKKIFNVTDFFLFKKKTSKIFFKVLKNFYKCKRCWNYFKNIKKYCKKCKKFL